MIKKVVILKPKKSLNFSESCNVGIKNSSSKYIFISNDDIIISRNTIEELKKNTTDNVITGPDSNCNLGFQTDYAYTVMGVRLVPAMSMQQVSHIIPQIYNIKPIKNDIIERSWLAFFATMFTRKCFEEVGQMDETFVYDREDLDWSMRAAAKGKKFHQVFSSYAFHFGGVSRKVKHQELGLKHDLDTEHNLLYYNKKYGIKQKPILAMWCYDAWEHWDEKSLTTAVDPNKPPGIGGSETQVILLSKEFSKLGYKVKIFNKCKENHFDPEGDIEYIPWTEFGNYSKYCKYDYFIAQRYVDCFDMPFEADNIYVMIHDVFLIMNGRNQYDVKKDRVKKYFCLSNRHKNYVSWYHNIPLDQILMTSNGLDFNRFKDIDESKRDPYKLIWSSSPDRGLEYFFPVLDKIKEQVPEVKLHIFYGFENFRDKAYVNKIIQEIDKRKEYIFYNGRVGQNRLAEEFKTSNIWSYFSDFSETFSISALEAMAAGAVILSSEFWGLIDTVKSGGILLPMNDNRNTIHTPEYQNRYIEECVRLIKDEAYRKECQQKGYERVKRFTWENVAKQWDTYFKTNKWKEIQ